MKFLYLKGIDIFGPFEVDQILKEDCFSEDLLVCPENKAEQEAAWKPAVFYEEFKTAFEKEIFPVKESEPAVNISPADLKITPVEEINLQAEEVNAQSEANNSQPEETNSQDLPPLEDTKTDTNSEDFDKFEPSFEQVMAELSDGKEKKEVNEEDEVEDHTFHIERQEDNLLEDLPAHSLLAPEEKADTDTKENTVKGQDHSFPLAPSAEVVDTLDNAQAKSTDFLEISNNKIISSSDGRVKERRHNDLIFILSFLAVTVVAVALCFAFFNMTRENNLSDLYNRNQPAKSELINQETISPAAQPEEDSSMQGLLDKEEPEISVEDRVINIVKDTELPNKGKTIGAYLQDTYSTGYQTSWSAKPFTDKVYIVEFFASQVRNEPYVYLFRVDIDQKKITGALNNITLDLLA